MKWPSIDPGLLRHQIVIMRQETVQGAAGPKPKWVEFIRTYASIEPASASDSIAAGQNVSELGLPVKINWQSGVESNMRVQARGGTYIIREVINELEMDVTLTLMCIALKGNQ